MSNSLPQIVPVFAECDNIFGSDTEICKLVKEIDSSFQDVMNMISELDNQLLRYQDDERKRKNEIGEKEQELQNVQKELQDNLANIQNLQNQINQQGSMTQKQQEEYLRLQSEYNQLVKESQDATKELNDLKMDQINTKNTIAQLQNEIQKYQTLYGVMTNINNNLTVLKSRKRQRIEPEPSFPVEASLPQPQSSFPVIPQPSNQEEVFSGIQNVEMSESLESNREKEKLQWMQLFTAIRDGESANNIINMLTGLGIGAQQSTVRNLYSNSNAESRRNLFRALFNAYRVELMNLGLDIPLLEIQKDIDSAITNPSKRQARR